MILKFLLGCLRCLRCSLPVFIYKCAYIVRFFYCCVVNIVILYTVIYGTWRRYEQHVDYYPPLFCRPTPPSWRALCIGPTMPARCSSVRDNQQFNFNVGRGYKEFSVVKKKLIRCKKTWGWFKFTQYFKIKLQLFLISLHFSVGYFPIFLSWIRIQERKVKVKKNWKMPGKLEIVMIVILLKF